MAGAQWELDVSGRASLLYGMVLLLMGIKVPGDERVYCI